jgi:hypothetical protein
VGLRVRRTWRFKEGIHFGGATALDDGDHVTGYRVFDGEAVGFLGDDQP